MKFDIYIINLKYINYCVYIYNTYIICITINYYVYIYMYT